MIRREENTFWHAIVTAEESKPCCNIGLSAVAVAEEIYLDIMVHQEERNI